MREGNPRLNRNEQMHLHHGSLVQLPAAGPPLHQISRTILHSGLINEVLRGKFLSPHEEDIVVTRRNSLQLYTEKLDPKGPVQPLFFSICNMQVLRAADCRTRASGPEGESDCDLLVIQAEGIEILFLKYSHKYRRFTNVMLEAMVDGQRKGDEATKAKEAMISQCPEEPGPHCLSMLPTVPLVASLSHKKLTVYLTDFGGSGQPDELTPSLPKYRVDLAVQAESESHAERIQLLGASLDQAGNLVGYVAVFEWRKRESCDHRDLVISTYQFPFQLNGEASSGEVSKKELFVGSFQIYERGPMLEAAAIPAGQGMAEGIMFVHDQKISVLSTQQLLSGDVSTISEQQIQCRARRTDLPYIEGHVFFIDWLDDAASPTMMLWGSRQGLRLLKLKCGSSHPQNTDPRTWLQVEEATDDTASPTITVAGILYCLPLSQTCILCSLNAGPVILISPASEGLHSSIESWVPAFSLQEPQSYDKDYDGYHNWLTRGATNIFSTAHHQFTRLHLGNVPLSDFIVLKTLEGPQGIGVSSRYGDEGSLIYFSQEWQAPIEYEGQPEATAISNIWSLKCFSLDSYHSVLLVSFTDATRAITAGKTMKDVSEMVNVCESERTIACGQIAEGVLAQITCHQIRCCSLLPLIENSCVETIEETSRKRSSLSANFSHLNMREGLALTSTSDAPTCTHRQIDLGSHDGQAQSQEFSETPSTWRPTEGESISCGCCAHGAAVVYVGGRNQGHLIALQYLRATSPAKRKRGATEDHRLERSCSLQLGADPSCMELCKGGQGTLTLIASLYGPRIEILGLEAEPGAASLQFRRICQVSEEVLCNSITMASLDAMAVLEQRTAESIHLLTYDNTRDHGLEQNSGSRSSRQSLQVPWDIGNPSCPAMVKAAVLLSLEHPCLSAVAGMQTKVEEQNYEVLLGWRSGYLLHIHVSAEQEVGPELHENQSLGCGEVKLCGLSNFGNSPVSSRRIPGDAQRFLIVGSRSAVVEYDSEQHSIDIQRVSLPHIRQAIPLNIDGKHKRCEKLLACVTSFNRLQLRRFQEPTRYQDGPVIKRRPLKYHPQAIALHRESRSIIVQYDKDVEFVSDYGWGKRHAVNLPDDRVVSGITTWQAKVEPSSEDDHKWKEEHDILLEDYKSLLDLREPASNHREDRVEGIDQDTEAVLDVAQLPCEAVKQAKVQQSQASAEVSIAIPQSPAADGGDVAGVDNMPEPMQGIDQSASDQQGFDQQGSVNLPVQCEAQVAVEKTVSVDQPGSDVVRPLTNRHKATAEAPASLKRPRPLIYVDEELVVICTSSDLLDPENMLPVAQDYADEKRGSEAGNFLLVMKMVRQSDGTWLPKLAQQRSFRRQIHACGTVRGKLNRKLVLSVGPYLYTYELYCPKRVSLGTYDTPELYTHKIYSPGQVTLLSGLQTDKDCRQLEGNDHAYHFVACDTDVGPVVWDAQFLDIPCGGPRMEVMATSQRRGPVHSCLALTPICSLRVPGHPRPDPLLVPDPGLVMTINEDGRVVTFGWCKTCPPGGNQDLMGSLEFYNKNENRMPTAFPDRSAASLGVRLEVLKSGCLSSMDPMESSYYAHYLTTSTAGEVISIDNTDNATGRVLRALQRVLAKHPATRPVTGDDHTRLRSKNLTIQEDRLIIDGNLLWQFNYLPGSVQTDIAIQLEALLGQVIQPSAITALLRDGMLPPLVKSQNSAQAQ